MNQPSSSYADRFEAVSSDGTTIAYWRSGRSSGPAIVLLHGFALNHSVWDGIVGEPSLRERFQLIAVDLRGHGDSGRPHERKAFLQGRLWADDLQAVLQAAGLERPVVVAWSYGGRMLNDYIRHYGTDAISGINYIAAATIADPTTLGVHHGCLAEVCSDDSQTAAAARRVFMDDVLRVPADSPQHESLLETLRSHDPRVLRWMRERPLNYDELLKEIDVPALISHGVQDSLLSVKHAHVLSGHLKQVRLNVIDNAGHAPFISMPRAYSNALCAFASACLSP